MINELHELANTLDSKGISSNEWHREYMLLPKVTKIAPCIRIWVADNSAICNIENVSAELARSLRKYGNNQGSFPGFNIKALYRITAKNQIETLKRIFNNQEKLDVGQIKAMCVDNNWQDSLVKKINRSLNDYSQKIVKIIDENGCSEENIISRLAYLTKKFTNETQNDFRSSLEKCILAKLQKGEELELLLNLLFYKGDASKEAVKDVGPNYSVVLDVQNWQPYKYPVANEYTTQWLNNILLSNVKDDIIVPDECAIDAFGDAFANPEEPMPSVKLHSFEVILRSMFRAQVCQTRYRRIDDASYPISAENRVRVKKSLEWIADPSRRGETWEIISKNDIVFAYPSKLPSVPLHITPLFRAGPESSGKKAEMQFEAIAKDFINTFNGLPTDEKPDGIQIFTIHKVDKGRSKIVFTHYTTPENLIKSANEWSSGCCNLPRMDLGKHTIPFPLETARIVNNVWKQNGELAQGKKVVERMKYYQGIELLLGILPQNSIHFFLHVILINSSGLVNYMGKWLNGGRKCTDKKEIKTVEMLKTETMQIFSVLGFLLYKCHERKEIYMENIAYLIGQLLNISDGLHSLYCQVKRNGEIPPQLAGSSLFITAGEMPYQAIAQLSKRMNPYLSWAKQCGYKQENGNAHLALWYLKRYEEVSDKLLPVMDSSIKFGDYEKAQLFIGYLASITKQETTANNMVVK